MTLTFNPLRAMAMTYSCARLQGQRSIGFENRRRDRQTHRQTGAIALPSSLMRSVTTDADRPLHTSTTLLDLWRMFSRSSIDILSVSLVSFRTFYSVSPTILHLWGFLKIFPKQLRIFKRNFTRRFYVYIYAVSQNITQLSLTLTKLCQIKGDRLVNFYISLPGWRWTAKSPRLHIRNLSS